MDAKTLAALAAHIADEKKAEDIQVFDVDERLKLADYFAVITGQNRTHVRALVNELHVRLKAMGERHQRPEGQDLGWWVVLDYGDVVVHVLQRDAREYYDLDHLYGDCPLLDWREVEVPASPQPDQAETA
jgi:ribosome-associated protein